MARQITSRSPVAMLPFGKSPAARRLWIAFLAASIILSRISFSWAESLAAKNKEGNRLFAEGKYEESEKAYLDAEAKDPGKPEILYNLGNAMIKQNKQEEALRALRQSIGKGDTRIKEHSWFNTGNAFFLIGNFKDSSEAYIQALRLDPADKDAKHNLELALQKLEQEKRQQSQTSQSRKDSKDSAENRSTAEKKNEQQNEQDRRNSENGKKPNDPQQSQSTSTARLEGSISKEQALQILDAVQDQELSEHRKLLEPRAGQGPSEKDW